MKKIVLLVFAVLFLPGCAHRVSFLPTDVQDKEKFCTSFGESCPRETMTEGICDFCGVKVYSNYASCHSKDFCDNTLKEFNK